LDGYGSGWDGGDGEESIDRTRVVRGDDLGVGRDASDETGEHTAGSDLHERGDPGPGHPLDDADPVDAGSEMFDELAPAVLGRLDRSGVPVGEQRR